MGINAFLPTHNKVPIQTTSHLPQNVNFQSGSPLGFSGGKSYFANGTRVPVGANIQKGVSIGYKNQVINNGGIGIGNNLKVQNSNQVVIGSGNKSYSNRPIEFTQNGKTAMCVTQNGMFMEGGGGVIYYEDTTTGEIREVMTGVPVVNLLKRDNKVYYTRVVKGNEDII